MNLRTDIAPLDHALADTLGEWFQCREPWFVVTVIAASQALQSGHSCLYLPHWAGRTLAVESEAPFRLPDLDDWQQRLARLPLAPDDGSPLVLEHQRLYLRRYWQFETELAQVLREKLKAVDLPDPQLAREILKKLFPDTSGTTVPDWQKVAAANALLQQFSIVAGGPGTGKTYTVTRLLACILECSASHSSEPPVVRLAAPTGKAAQRLAESVSSAKASLGGLVSEVTIATIPDQGVTLHRLLGVMPGNLQFRHHRSNPLALDILVVDEASMVDLPLMTRLFRALPEHCRVILLGDSNQLPSVAAGAVLADLAGREHPGYSPQRLRQLAALGIVLDQAQPGHGDYLSVLRSSRRFASDGGIGQLAEQVLGGDGKASLALLQGNHDELGWIPENDFGHMLGRWMHDFFRPLARAENLAAAFSALARFRILCPTRVGHRGVNAINDEVVRRLNPSGAPFFTGQPIMITRNQYDLGLYNGDIGLIWPGDGEQPLAWFPDGDGYRALATGRLPEHETVYAMTIHKTQGSEFDHVALVLPERPHINWVRELVYTAITRSRTRFDVCGTEGVWCAGVEQKLKRDSGLRLRVNLALA